MTGLITIRADYSEIENLAAKLEAARQRPHKVRAEALDRIAGSVQAEAIANAQSFHTDSTGELAASVEREGTPVFQRIFSKTRQASFLEYGSPTTGAPRPWLTGPAQRGADDLFDEISKAADPLQ